MDKKTTKVAIIDYGLGNLFSVQRACEYAGLKSIITNSKYDILESDAIILPGVGAFNEAMKNLKKYDLMSPIHDFAKTGKHIMGICLGMQLMFTESEEFGNTHGLNLIPGKVVKFNFLENENHFKKIPQIDWNHINTPKKELSKWDNTPLQNIEKKEYLYFVHSFYTIPDNEKNILSITKYGNIEYCSSAIKNNIVAFQFHPEKSGPIGLKIYKTWAQLINN